MPTTDFLADPQIAYSNLQDTSKFPAQQAKIIDGQLNLFLKNTINSFFSGADSDIKKAVSSGLTKLDYRKYRDLAFADILQTEILDKLTKTSTTATSVSKNSGLAKKISQYIGNRFNNIMVAGKLYLDEAVENNPIFHNELRIARVNCYVALAGLNASVAKNLLAENMDPDLADEETLDGYVSKKEITADQATAMNLILELARLTDNNIPLIQLILSKKISAIIQLVPWERTDWQQLISGSKPALVFPLGETADSYVETLYQNIDATFPSQRFFKRLVDQSNTSVNDILNALNPVIQNGQAQVINKTFADANGNRLSTVARQSPADTQSVVAFTNTFHALGAADIVNDQSLTAQAKTDAINGRISQLNGFLTNNADMDVRYIDFFGQDGLNWGTITGDDKTRIRKQLMTAQRMMELADNTDDRFTLLQKGFDSAWAVSNYTETQFTNVTGFDQVKAQRHHQKALLSVHRSSHYFQTVQDSVAGVFKNSNVSNVDPSLINNIAAVDGFRDLFGPQNYCDCEDCRSVLSPAAYFVDLMQFIKEHISRPVFINKNLTDSSLYLKNRRDDLWHLKLSCENTNTLVPYLTIVDDILETYIGKMVQGDVYEMLSQSYANDSFRLPFNLPLEEARVYLSHFSYTLFDAFRLLKLDDLHIWREQLKLSQEELQIITATNPNHGPFQIFRIPGSQSILINDTDDPGQNINASGLLNIAGISRTELTDFLDSKYNPALKNIQVNKIAQSGGFGFIETLSNISDDDLDYMQRFIRLQKKTGWQIPDLDDVLNQLQLAGAISGTLDQPAVLLVGKFHYIRHELKLSIDRLCAMIYEMPVSESFPVPPEKTADLRLYEKAFDLEDIFGVANKDTGALNTSVNYHLYILDTTNPADTQVDPITPYLVGGLGVSEPELLLLFSLLKNELQFDSNGNTSLDRLKLSLLYRHAKLARALHLPIEDFIDALALVFDPAQMVIKSADQILALMDFCDQLTKWNLSPQEIVFIVNGTGTSNITYNTTTDILSSMIDAVKTSTDPDKIAEFNNQLQQQFSVSQNLLQDMLQWIAADINDPAILNVLSQPVANKPDAAAMAPLMQVCQQLERVQRLFNKFSYDEEQVDYLSSNFTLLGIADLNHLKAADLFNLGYFKSLIAKDAETEAAMENVLASYKAAGNFSGDSISALALFWNVQESLVKSIVSSLALSAVPLEAVSDADQALSVCNLLGINGYSLKKLGNDSSYEAIKSAKNVALGAFSSKYEDETVREEMLDPYNDKINVAKRNALCEYILAKEKTLHFKNKDDLYDFFLVDVKMGGCSRTSKIDCAILSLQLYVTRVLANLEQSADGKISVLSDMEGLGDFKDEWEWRGSYSSWVSNRKVFLYPENYIQPESLDIQTSLYSDLQNQLLQGKVTRASVEAAYNNYIAGFSDLAQLKICGSFYNSDEKTYYLFGRTMQDPGQLYYRTWQDKSEWTSWQTMNLSVGAQHIAATKYLERLFIFWIDIKEDKQTGIEDSNAYISSVIYNYTLSFSYQKEDGKWSTPQKLDYYSLTDGKADLYSDPDSAAAFEFLFKGRFRATKIYCSSDSELIIENFVLGIPAIISGNINLFSNQTKDASPGTMHTSDQTVYLFSGSLLDEDTKPTNHEAALYIGKKLSGNISFVDYELVTQDIIGMTQVTGIFSGKVFEPYLTLVQGTTDSYYFRMGAQQFLIYGAHAFSGNKRISQMVRISTSLPEEFSRILFKYGIKQFLSLNTQMKTEQDFQTQLLHPKKLHPPYLNPQQLDFKGPYGDYFKELFFHIPFLIGNHLNSNQHFETAKWWYERVFDPTAKESPQDKKPADRCWRYIEFRDVKIEKMQAALTDKAAIAQYKKNPFDPDAIARLRMGVYQKAVVMKYIDNLLDWGDSLFTTFTIESVNEATMLYMLASDILGRRPADTGPCNDADEDELTFNELSSVLDGDSDFLIYLETWSNTQKNQKDYSTLKVGEYINTAGPNRPEPQNDVANFSDIELPVDTALQSALQQKPSVTYNVATYAQTSKSMQDVAQEIYEPQVTKRLPGHEAVKQICLAFCVPKNDVLLGYWDRVEDRLYKIRHCMNIMGVKKQLALFQSGLGKKLAEQAGEAGLTLEEMLKALNNPLPPYRFEYLIEKAKQFTQTVQSFGSALLSALEKKDTERLNLLRTLHEKQILNLTTKVKEDAVSQAQNEELALEEQQKNVQNKIDYYADLIDGGLNTWESLEQDSKMLQTTFIYYKSVLDMMTGFLFSLPQVGSPFAITFGGKQMGDMTKSLAVDYLGDMASIAEIVGASAGLEAGFQRREDEWNYQLETARQEMQQVQKQILAAKFKMKIAQRDLTIHNKSIQQNKEMNDFYKNKFTNLGLYQFLSNTLTRLYRDAYNMAFDTAVQAEQGYQLETDDDTPYIATDNWEYDRAGLLAGEKLMLQLHLMEKAYIENNKRAQEIHQVFSLALIDPTSLLQLKEAASCSFTLPEILYDIYYPGQYNRQIKSVRLTIPCVVGPYTNISTKLSLENSWIRKKDKLTINALDQVQDAVGVAKGMSVTTSSAQNDAGLFDLNFRDERYLPFEGAGAISKWTLELPAQLRSFNYDSISDVIIEVSYTAREDADFRDTVEGNITNAISTFAATNGLSRLFSMKYEFPDVFFKLMNSAPQTADMNIVSSHFPYMFSDKNLNLTGVTVFLKNINGKTITTANLSVKLDGLTISAWEAFPSGSSGNVLQKGQAVASGTPLKKWTISTDNGGLKIDEIDDIFFAMSYRLA